MIPSSVSMVKQSSPETTVSVGVGAAQGLEVVVIAKVSTPMQTARKSLVFRFA